MPTQVHRTAHSLKATGLHEFEKAGATREERDVAGTWLGKNAGDTSYAQSPRNFACVSELAGVKGDPAKSHVLGRSRFPAEWFQAMVTGANCLSCVLFYSCRPDTLLFCFIGYMEGASAEWKKYTGIWCIIDSFVDFFR